MKLAKVDAKIKRRFQIGGAIALIILGLALILAGPITNAIVKHNQDVAMSQKIRANQKNKKASFDFDKVKNVSATTAVKSLSNNAAVIGKISVPSLKMVVPIYEGVDNTILLYGAGTMKQNQKMGKGNYALAGHNYDSNPAALFGPLAHAKKGKKIYLTDGKKMFTYKILSNRVVDPTAVHVINDVPGMKLLTLITCADGGSDRYCIRGKLVKTQKLTNKLLKTNFPN